MILESIVVAACFAGNNDSCNSGLQGYVKHYKLDEQAQVVEQNIKKQYPSMHFGAVVAGTLAYKKYNTLLYRNIWYQGDFTNPNNYSNMVIYKYNF